MIDDSVPFDGTTARDRPLGGAEKAFASLAAALAARGHEVAAINRCPEAGEHDGVAWLPWETPRPTETDVLIAFRKPPLLAEVDEARHRILWMWGPPHTINESDNQAVMDRLRPTVVFVGARQQQAWKSWRDFREAVVLPGVDGAYRTGAEPSPKIPAIALMTTHPLVGLQDVVALWRDNIHSRCPDAELHVYSAALYRAMQGGGIDDRMNDVFEAVRDASVQGVSVRVPRPDPEMAEIYRSARVHLYPASVHEMYGSTLAESQAVGLPAIVRSAAGGGAEERIRNGQTGYLVPDDEAFANVTVEVLSNDPLQEGLSRDAWTMQA
ncbi:MAG: glycosyltransferase, partial [Proteobacteria bacterium]|nr:glycosyltransferase [Pseudomonadota bacterium]